MTTPAWIAWLTATLVLILSSRNPVYLGCLLAGEFLLGIALQPKARRKGWFIQNIRFSFFMWVLSASINTLFTHTGSTVLFKMPSNWPLIGGAITLESLMHGWINGLVINALFLCFSIINIALSTKQMVKLIPRMFHPLAMMITISLTFFPSVQKKVTQIKEAQMIRGNPMNRLRDWLAILMPLLITSLENAILMSESMTSRGFLRQDVEKDRRQILIGLILAAFLIFSGWILQSYAYPQMTFILLYIVGFVLLGGTLFLAGRKVKTTTYHQEKFTGNDALIILISILTISLWIILKTNQRIPSADYQVYPTLQIPSLGWSALIYLFPILPVIINKNDTHQRP